MRKKTPKKKAQFRLTLTCDGGACPNPGQTYGSFSVRGDSGYRLDGQRIPFGWGSNNEAEYKSLIAGLKAVLSDWPMPATTHISIRSDSRLVIEQVKGSWKVKKSHLRVLRDEAGTLLGQFGSHDLAWHERANSVGIFGH